MPLLTDGKRNVSRVGRGVGIKKCLTQPWSIWQNTLFPLKTLDTALLSSMEKNASKLCYQTIVYLKLACKQQYSKQMSQYAFSSCECCIVITRFSRTDSSIAGFLYKCKLLYTYVSLEFSPVTFAQCTFTTTSWMRHFLLISAWLFERCFTVVIVLLSFLVWNFIFFFRLIIT